MIEKWYDACSLSCAFAETSEATPEAVDAFKQIMVRLFSLLSACGMRQISNVEDENFETIDLMYFEEEALEYMAQRETLTLRTECVHHWCRKVILNAAKEGVIQT